MHSFLTKVASAGGPSCSFLGWLAAQHQSVRMLLTNGLAGNAPALFVGAAYHGVQCYNGHVNDEDVGKK